MNQILVQVKNNDYKYKIKMKKLLSLLFLFLACETGQVVYQKDARVDSLNAVYKSRIDSIKTEFNNYKFVHNILDTINSVDILDNQYKIELLSQLLLMAVNRADSLYNVSRLALIFAFNKIDTLNKHFDKHKHQVMAYDTLELREINYYEFYPGNTHEDSLLYKNILDSLLNKMFYNVIIHNQ